MTAGRGVALGAVVLVAVAGAALVATLPDDDGVAALTTATACLGERQLRVELPGVWELDPGPGSPLDGDWQGDDEGWMVLWSVSATDDSAGTFRIRRFDRPDRSVFVDSVDPGLPSLDEAAAAFVAGSVDEFGKSPAMRKVGLGDIDGWLVEPRPDSGIDGISTIFAEGAPGFRFMEVVVDTAHVDHVLESFSLGDSVGCRERLAGPDSGRSTG